MNHVLEAKKVVNPLFQTERGAGERQSAAGSSLRQRMPSSEGAVLKVRSFIHSFMDLTLNWELVYLLMCSFTENEPKPASLPVTISLASPVCLPCAQTWGHVAKHGAVLQRGWAAHGLAWPHRLPDYTRARPHVCLCRYEPGLCDPGQCPPGPG